jgi:hypothetical protein
MVGGNPNHVFFYLNISMKTPEKRELNDMGKVGKEIIQSRIWMMDAPKPPDANYKDIFPITTIDAVKDSMEDGARSLRIILDDMLEELHQKQKILPSKPSTHLVTYGGKAGAVGNIPMTTKISWEPAKQSHQKIPTEKAVGDLLIRFGLIDKTGGVPSSHGRRVNWADVLGKPEIYRALGDNDDGFMTQKAITDALKSAEDSLDEKISGLDLRIKLNEDRIIEHTSDYNNPHHVTADQIGAVSEQALTLHTTNYSNPHNVTKEQLGLSDVDNTSDENKPISKATQHELDQINDSIHTLNDSIQSFITNATYDINSGKLTLTTQHGTTIIIDLPINGLVDDVRYDASNKSMVITELSGDVRHIDVSDLYNNYIGATTKNIDITIHAEPDLNTYSIHGELRPNSITNDLIADQAVSGAKIVDNSVTKEKIADGSINTDKIIDESITSKKIAFKTIDSRCMADRSIFGRSIFTSPVKNRLLAVIRENADPVYVQANADMLADYAVTARSICTGAVSTDKIAERAITTEKIAKNAITYNEIASATITGENIAPNTIQGENLIEGITLPGTPFIDTPPDIDSDGNEIITAGWANEYVDHHVNENKNIGDRAINGRTLFTSSTGHKALVVYEKDTDPVWGLITNRMMAFDSIGTDNIINQSITSDKIGVQSVLSKHILDSNILTNHLQESAVTSDKIFTSTTKNTVLAALTDNGHPVYSKITREMLMDNLIGSNQLEDRSITLNKLFTSDKNNRLLAVVNRGTDPAWIQATNEMIADHAINGRTLFRSQQDDTVLGVHDSKLDPTYLKITANMIENGTIEGRNINLGTLEEAHIKDGVLTDAKIANRSISAEKLKGRTITGAEMFSSLTPSRVLAVSTTPLSDPDWMQVTTDMIEDKAITREKIFRSAYYYRVLAASAPGVPPEYIKITADYIVDYSITPDKLQYDFLLYGHPSISKSPPINADNMLIANTSWVRSTIKDYLKAYSPSNYNIATEQLLDRAVTGQKLFSSENGYEVLGVLEPRTDPVYTKILGMMIANKTITADNLADGLMLPENTCLRVRPPEDASDHHANGNLVPDCQWTLDAIEIYAGSGLLTLKFEEEHFIWKNGWLSINMDRIICGDDEIRKLFDPSISIPTPPPLTGVCLSGSAPAFTFHQDFFELNDRGEISLNFYKLFGDISRTAALFGVHLPEEYWGTEGAPVPMITNDAKFNANHFVLSPDGVIGLNLPQIMATIQNILDLFADNYTIMPEPIVPPIHMVAVFGTSPHPLTPGSGAALKYRSVNGNYLFSSDVSNRVLVVHDAGTDAVWDQIKTEMIQSGAITNDKMAPHSVDIDNIIASTMDNVVLATQSGNTVPMWIKVQREMIESEAIDSSLLAENAVITDKIRDKAVTFTKLADGPMVDTEKLFDRSVTGLKIQLNTIETDNLKESSVTSSKLDENLEFRGRPTVVPDTAETYEKRSLRNTIISPNAPEGGQDGDIWLRYI